MIKIKFWIIFSLLLNYSSLFAQNWVKNNKIVASDRSADDFYGGRIAISQNYMLVGVPSSDTDSNGTNLLNDAGSAYVYNKDSNGEWVELIKLAASDRESGDSFGGAVAMNDNYLVISAPFEDDDVSGQNTLDFAGAVYLYERSDNDVWMEVQKIIPDDRVFSHVFGASVAIEDDFIFVGASGNNEGVYVFKRENNGVWNQVQKIVSSEPGNNDDFGASIVVSDDYMVVGAPVEDEDSNGGNVKVDAGAAFVYKKDGPENWTFLQKIVPNDRDQGDTFGLSIGINENILVVGSHQEDHSIDGNNFLNDSGSVYVFEKDIDGLWNETQKVVASDRESGDWFGLNLSISDEYFVVGAIREDHDIDGTNVLNDSGSVYVFEKDINGLWSQTQKVVDENRASGDSFGSAVLVEDDYLFIGLSSDDEDSLEQNFISNSGSFIILQNENTLSVTENNLQKVSKIYPNPTNDSFEINLDKTYNSIRVNITNILGQIVKKVNFYDENTFIIEINQPNGIYFVNLEADLEIFKTIKIVKN
ncbi:T9SS type A sorting domain-containing protein [Aquimarina sp. MMG015]|uniref:T9SS type A sorting domain-containing protein n=1 Tax=Aquimarina sp. MMG015 TaxID=2822689 RepID=UPI001B3A1D9C|nr:T9SS type A sorting domain-containing protein [Aquimarina sp. MMG015]MBQ4805752.1 T9SS type A sorting domain-containing protein [Aquimarina sp. MMG015]